MLLGAIGFRFLLAQQFEGQRRVEALAFGPRVRRETLGTFCSHWVLFSMALSRLSSLLSCQEDLSFRVVPGLGWLVSGAESRWKALATWKSSEGRQCSTSGRTKVKRQGPCCTWCCWRSEARATDSRQARWVRVRASRQPMAEERGSLRRRCFSTWKGRQVDQVNSCRGSLPFLGEESLRTFTLIASLPTWISVLSLNFPPLARGPLPLQVHP